MTTIANLTITDLTMLAVVETFENGRPNLFGQTYFNPNTHELSGGLLMASFLSGTMGKLLTAYQLAGGSHIDSPFIDSATSKIPDPTKIDVVTFRNQFKEAAADPIMMTTQKNFFASQFLDTAKGRAAQMGITEPLGVLTILDSTVQGGLHSVISFMKAQDLNQWEWVRQYVAARKIWLSSRTTTVGTVYRMNVIQSFIDANNWKLGLPLNVFSQRYIITEQDVL